jgi:hypothetical protein
MSQDRGPSLLGCLLQLALVAAILVSFFMIASAAAQVMPWWLGGPPAFWGWILLGGIVGGFFAFRWLWHNRLLPMWEIWLRQLTYSRKMTAPDPRDVSQLRWRDTQFDPQLEISLRENSDEYFIGVEDAEVGAPAWVRGQPVVVTSKELRLHMQVVGSTGAGKSVLLARPLAVQHILKGGGLVLTSFKPDSLLLGAVIDACDRAGRLNAFRFLSLDPSRPGSTYNPLLGGPSYTRAERVTRGLGMRARGHERYFVELARQLMQLFCDAGDAYGEVLTFRRCQQLLNETTFDPAASTHKGRVGGALPHWLYRVPGTPLPPKEGQKWDGETREGQRLFMRLAGMDLRHATDVRQLLDKWSAIPALNSTQPTLNLAEALRENQVVYLELTTSVGPEVAGQLATTILEHLVYSYQSAEAGRSEQSPLFLVLIDEFAALAREEFLLLAQQARSFSVGYVLLHQALADLEQVSPTFGRQLAALMNTRILFQLRDGRDAEYASRSSGTTLRPSPFSGVQKHTVLPTTPGDISARDIQAPLLEQNIFLRMPTLQTTGDHAKAVVYDAAGVPRLTTMRPLPRIEMDTEQVLAELYPERPCDEPSPLRPLAPVAAAGNGESANKQPGDLPRKKTRRSKRAGRSVREYKQRHQQLSTPAQSWSEQPRKTAPAQDVAPRGDPFADDIPPDAG